MKLMPFLALFSTGIVVAACARGCEQGTDVLPNTRPTQRVTDKPLPSPGPAETPTQPPTTAPTMAMKTFVVPKVVKVNEPFMVRAYVGSLDLVEVFAEEYRLGFMGWSAACKCKELLITLNTPGEREIIFSNDGVALASEMILVEAK